MHIERPVIFNMVTLYTTDCPKCKVLEAKLDAKGVEYVKETDLDSMINLGFMSAPVLKVEESKYLPFAEAIKWVNERS